MKGSLNEVKEAEKAKKGKWGGKGDHYVRPYKKETLLRAISGQLLKVQMHTKSTYSIQEFTDKIYPGLRL